MMKRLLCVLFVLSVVALEEALGQSDRDTNCAKMNFATLPKTCCKKPFGDVFNTKMVPAIKQCKPTAKLWSWANSYKINLLQDQLKNNFVDVTQTKIAKDLCTYGGFMECIFKANDWLDTASNSINVKALLTHLTKVSPDGYWKDMVEKMLIPLDQANQELAYNFRDIVNDRFESITCGTRKVNLLPLMMAQMIQSDLVWMCPEVSAYTKKNKCQTQLESHQFCDAGKIYSTSGEGIFHFPQV